MADALTLVGSLQAFFLLLLSGASEGQLSCTTPEGERGTCMSIRECPPLSTLVSQLQSGTGPPNGAAKLRGSICNLAQMTVCCPSTNIPVTVRTVTAPTPEECGLRWPFVEKIVGGAPAPLRAWPWMAILRGNTGGRSFWFCGGTLISSRFVVTAAHCFKGRIGVNLEFVRIGEHDLSKNQDCASGACAPAPQDIPTERIIMHPEYSSPCNECNDIALLKLSREAVFHQWYVVPICLPLDPASGLGYTANQLQNKHAWATGWGTTSGNPFARRLPTILHQVQLQIRELPFCQMLKRDYPDKDMAICAGGDGGDTCKGDSGGPLTLTGSNGLKHFLVGVTSRGPVVCGSNGTQGLYTNVQHYIPWILREMQS